MLDINLIRETPDTVREALQKRQMDAVVVDQVRDLDLARRKLLAEVEQLKAVRNAASKEIGQLKDPQTRQAKIEAMRAMGDQIAALDAQTDTVETELRDLVSRIPNIPLDSVPLGVDDSQNPTLRTVGEIRQFNFPPQVHWDLAPRLGILNFDQGARITGSRFYVLSGAGARLQRTLIAWMLDLHIRQGYREQYTPFMVKGETMYASGQLPNTAYTPCFRREKMSAGRDVRGIKRGHQFDKVEMYIFCRPEDSMIELDKMTADAEETCRLLGLPYRVKQICTGDLGFNA